MKNRRAISLLELLFIMSAAITLLSLTGVLMHRAMILQMDSRARTNAENTTLRLSDQFRRDVHDANGVEPDNSQNGAGIFLRIRTFDARTIEYLRKNGNVLRLESGGSKPVRREEFEFPLAAQLKIVQVADPPRVVLTIQLRAVETPPADSQAPLATNVVPLSIDLEPSIGRNRHLTVLPKNQEAPR